MILGIFIIILIVWSIYLYYLLNNGIFKFLKFDDSLTKEEKFQYRHYLRSDKIKINKLNLYIKGFFLIPFRAFGYFIILFTIMIILKILCFYYNIDDFEKEFPKSFDIKSRKICNIFMELLNKYFLGLNIKYELIKSNNPTPIEERENCKLIISNHTSWIDARYFVQHKSLPSLLMDEFFKNIFMIGFFSKLNKNIFIKNTKDDKNNRNKVYDSLNKRVNEFKKGTISNPLLIFPEGITSNSNVILPFRKGAFSLGIPIRIICLDYRNNDLIPDMTLFNFLGCFLLPLTNFQNNLTVYEFDRLLYPHDYLDKNNEIDSIRMANDCRKMISDNLNLEFIDIKNVYKSTQEFMEFRKKKMFEINKEVINR